MLIIVNNFNRGLLSRGEVEMSPTTHAIPVENHSKSYHSRNISEVVRPYQPVVSDEESDIYDDCTWHESSIIARELGIDDVDRHRHVGNDDVDGHIQPKPSVENVYRYSLIYIIFSVSFRRGSPGIPPPLLKIFRVINKV